MPEPFEAYNALTTLMISQIYEVPTAAFKNTEENVTASLDLSDIESLEFADTSNEQYMQ